MNEEEQNLNDFCNLIEKSFPGIHLTWDYETYQLYTVYNPQAKTLSGERVWYYWDEGYVLPYINGIHSELINWLLERGYVAVWDNKVTNIRDRTKGSSWIFINKIKSIENI